MIRVRDAAGVLAEVISLLPIGRAWVRDRTSDLVRTLKAFADAIGTLEQRVAELADEINPATATRLLSSFERVLGPDPCGLDDAGGPLAVRRLAAWRRWTHKGGQSIAWFVALAAGYGISITVETYRPTVAGDELGGPLIMSPEQFVWTVKLSPLWERPAICGDQVCGDYLGEVGLSPIECLIRRWAPAHTIVVFDYSGA